MKDEHQIAVRGEREKRGKKRSKQKSRLDRKGEQTIPGISSTSLAERERERREERRGGSERWRASMEYK